ncbi:MAG: ABC transporter substrate-binding protein [Actinomycetota bacterium]|nr:ABC transporter substrate-binding protein [Actinomycetota bacterium]
MRGYVRKLALPFAAAFVLVVVGTAGGAAVKGGTLIFGTEGDPVALDGALVSDGTSLRILDQISEGLVDQKPGTTVVVPSLATSWKGAQKGRVWTFNLRHGVLFHDGTKFSSKSVCFNFNRWYNFTGSFQSIDATYYWQQVFGGFKNTVGKSQDETLNSSLYRSCKTIGPYKVQIILTRPSASFLAGLALRNFAIMSPTALVKYGADQGEVDANGVFHPAGSFATKHPIGTGPFKFESWILGEKLTITRFAKYWGTKALVDKVIFRPVADNAARLQALQTGELNVYDLVDPQDFSTIEKNTGLRLAQRGAFNVAYVGMQQNKPPMNKLKVRQAVAYGLDRSTVVKALYRGLGQVAKEFMPPSMEGYAKNVVTYNYNPEKSKALLREAGLTLPVKVDFYYFTRVRQYLPAPKETFEAFKASLEKSGFDVTPHVLPFRPDYLSVAHKGDAGDLHMLGWGGDFGDPDNFLGVFFQRPNPEFGFKNPKIHKLLDRAEAETNHKKRVALYQQANRLIMKDLPMIPFAHSKSAFGLQKRVKGLIPSPVQIEWLRLISIGGA